MTASTPERRLKVLYVAMRYDYGHPERGNGFEHTNFYETLIHMGVDTIYFDFMQLLREHGRERMNRRLREVVDEEKPDILFSVLYKNEIDRSVMKDISDNTDTVTVNWFCDDHWRFEGFSRRWAHAYNWIATTTASALPKYHRIGCEHVVQTQWAVNPFTYHPSDQPLQYDVTFIGQPHGKRRQMIAAIEAAGIPVKAWGNGWPAGRLSQEEMVTVFGTSRINLNFSAASTRGRSFFPWTKHVEQIKGRHFEVPGCGGFLLTGDAEDSDHYYKPGQEIVVAKTLPDIITNIRYYLSHEDERAAIARAGYERTMREHTYVHRFCSLFTAMGFSLPDPQTILDGKSEQGHVTVIDIKDPVPLVSVVMPVYNGEEHLEESIRSILGQSFTDFELILLDDGSSKALTLSLLNKATTMDPRIRLIRQENKGKGPARLAGSLAAKGTYIAIMDQDDVALPDRLGTQVRFLEVHPEIGAVGSWGELIDDTGTICGSIQHPTLPGTIRWAVLMKNPVLNSTGMVRREIGEKIGWYRDRAAEDYDFWSRAARHSAVANIPRYLLQYRKWDGAYTASSMDKLEASSVPIMQEGAEELLGEPVPLADVTALRRATSGVTTLSTLESLTAASLLQRLRKAYMRTTLTKEERRFVRDFTAEWLCFLAGRLRASGSVLSALRLIGSAFLLNPVWTIRSLFGRPAALLQSEQPRKTVRSVVYHLLHG